MLAAIEGDGETQDGIPEKSNARISGLIYDTVAEWDHVARYIYRAPSEQGLAREG